MSIEEIHSEAAQELQPDNTDSISDRSFDPSAAPEELSKTSEESFKQILDMLQKESVVNKNESVEKSLSDVISKLESLEDSVRSVCGKQDRNDAKLNQTLRENANFQVQVRRGMQQDIDSYKEQLSGERFDVILKDIAAVYVEYGSVLEDGSMEERTRKNLESMFEQLEDILTDYGADIIRSSEGDVRRPRVTKVINKLSVNDESKHNTVAKSRKPGVVRDRVILYPEFVDVYIYEPKSESEE